MVRTAIHLVFGCAVLASCGADSAEWVDATATIDGVRFETPGEVGPNPVATRPVSGLVQQQYALEKLSIYEAWEVELGSPEIVVAVIDSGVDAAHPDLAPRMWANPNELENGIDDDGNGYVDDLRGWDFVEDDNTPLDLADHGTHVAGIIAARGRYSNGVAGVANVTIMPLRVLDANRQGVDTDVAIAINYAVRNGADIINVSLGGASSSAALRNACLAAERAGILVVAAVGNQGGTAALYPAGYETVIGVAAVDENDSSPAFSNSSDAVDLAAPGVNILSTVLNGRFGFRSGTSMATAYVAGIAALARSMHPDWTPAQLRTALIATADDVNISGWDAKTGYGRVNAIKALMALPADGSPASGAATDDTSSDTLTAGEQLPATPLGCGFGVLPGLLTAVGSFGAFRRKGVTAARLPIPS